MLAADGRCKALDAAADGYGRAEAAGALLLAPVLPFQPAEDALDAEDGDLRGDRTAPLMLLAGTAVNQDGRSSSLTTPNGPAQQVCITTRWVLQQVFVRNQRGGVIASVQGRMSQHWHGSSLS